MGEPNYEDIPAIAVSQWREGRVLSADDVKVLTRMIAEYEAECNEALDAFSSGREQVLRELGGQEFVDLDKQGMEIDGKLAFKRACVKVAEKQADLDRMNQ